MAAGITLLNRMFDGDRHVAGRHTAKRRRAYLGSHAFRLVNGWRDGLAAADDRTLVSENRLSRFL